MGCSRLMGADDEAAHRRDDMFEGAAGAYAGLGLGQVVVLRRGGRAVGRVDVESPP
jgi:hypothetical protein